MQPRLVITEMPPNLSRIIYLFIIGLSLVSIGYSRNGMDPSCAMKLNNCTYMVKPYLHDLRYMFPTNLNDVDEMCKMWSQFVDCVRRYVSSCFNDEKRSKFNSAVENSVDTVHAICSSEDVQREYLNNAECFRKVSIENCGVYYRQLIDHVSNPRAHDDHICCAYGQFKNCVNDPLLRECGHRARNLMDHSMGFLITRCGEKAQQNPSKPCPVPAPIPTTTESFQEINDISQKARADRSYGPETFTTWEPATVVYTMPPEPGSQTSGSNELYNGLIGVLMSFFVSFCLI